jgi:DTW domain-containing protein
MLSQSERLPVIERRPTCSRCERPLRTCYCRHLASLPTRTRVILLQHPREAEVAIGTARMAHLSLPGSELHVGIEWDQHPAVLRALADPTRKAALLYPGKDAIDVGEHPPDEPVTLFVVDGTWAQTKKLVRKNPALARLPRYAFTPRAPSEYRIRKEPRLDYVSTIEALAHVLSCLEGAEDGRFERLLLPFRALIDTQIDHQTRIHCSRHTKVRAAPKPPRLSPLLADPRGDFLVVTGEANAWPYRDRRELPEELVHWLAFRVSDGALFEAVIAPRNPLCPNTSKHVELSEGEMLAGEPWTEVEERFRAFVRPTDVVLSWGHYATALFRKQGGWLPARHVDLRKSAGDHLKGKIGSLEAYVDRVPVVPEPVRGRGRGGERLALSVAATRVLAEAARASRREREG